MTQPFFYLFKILPKAADIPKASKFAAATAGPMGRSKIRARENPERAHTEARIQEIITTPRKLRIKRIAERAGNIMRAEISREPTSFIAITIITAVTVAIRILYAPVLTPTAVAKSSSKVTANIFL